jgi:hypothetical protein
MQLQKPLRVKLKDIIKMSYYGRHCDVSVLTDKVLKSVESTKNEILFTTADGEVYKMFHAQDCCERVYIESIVGDLQDLVGEPIVRAEESTDLFDIIRNIDKDHGSDESHTWTFYKFATRKGYVDIRWYGSSNGYYSESVSFVKD